MYDSIGDDSEPSTTMRVRMARAADFAAMHSLSAAAFKRPAEAELIDKLRAADALLLAQVATGERQLLGCALYSPATVTGPGGQREYPALGPIAVVPAWQRRGLGTALMRAGMAALRRRGHALLFLIGHVSYYPRFGFEPALPHGFTCDYVQPGGAHEHFMLLQLQAGILKRDSFRGHLRFHPAFDEV